MARETPATNEGARDEAPRREPPGLGAALAQVVRNARRGEPLPRAAHLVIGLAAPMAVLLGYLWWAHPFTVDDAYISYRYARNFANGLGLVYNAGEPIEGYTNFLWTVLLAGAAKVGVDLDVAAKVLGGLSACGSLAFIYAISARLRPFATVPCLATWLFATSAVNAGYAVFGLETGLFVCAILGGAYLVMRERERPGAFPFSGLVFAVAGLTRPEAPMYLGLMMLFLGRGFFGRQNLLRGAIFVLPIALHMLWRHDYYGHWLPNTLSAKTGNLEQQLQGGFDYLERYFKHVGPVVWLALFGLGDGIARRERWSIAFAVIGLAVLGYVTLVGGDWMPYFRFAAPFEPFCFVLAGIGARAIFELRAPAAALALTGFLMIVGFHRAGETRKAFRHILRDEKVFWDSAAGGAADWLRANEPGEIGVADIGYIGYATDYPLFDLLGLVDPVISKLPGGYTNKTGSGYVERVFEKMPKYFVFVGRADTCEPLAFPGQEKLRRDRRFQARYRLAGTVRHSKNGLWCIFARGDDG